MSIDPTGEVRPDTSKFVSHGFARLIQHAVKTPPTTYRGIVHGAA